MVAPDFMGTLPGWITSAGVVALLAAVLRYRLGWRGQTLGDEADIRDHYAQEVAALREKLDGQEEHFRSLEKHWREILEGSDRRHQECEDSRQAQRAEINKMHEEIAGLRAQIRAASTDRVLRMEEEPPPAPHARAAAKRVKNIIEDDNK